MRYLTPEEILIVHSEIIDQTGGSHGVRDPHLLASSASRPKATYAGEDLYKTVFEKAAACMHSLAMHHVFIDGNKRTSITTAARFLHINRYELEVSNEEMENFVLRTVVEKLDIKDIAVWLKIHSQKIK